MDKSVNKSNNSVEKMTVTRERMTPIQLQMLVDIIGVNPELINGKVNTNFTNADRKNKWMALASLLNSKGLGPKKDADRWRKTWSDLKFSVRSKAARMELEGGVEYMCKRLTNTEKRVLQMIGDVSVNIRPEDDGNESSTLSIENVTSLSETENKSSKPQKLILPVWSENSESNQRESHGKLDNDDPSQNSMDEEEVDEPPSVSYGTDNTNYDNANEGDDEFADDNMNETLEPPSKKRKVLKKNNQEMSPTLIAVQQHIELQTEVLREQTSILKEISKSLQTIARALQNK